MKKITTLFILATVFVYGLFAEPKVPKYYFGENLPKDDTYIYVSQDCQNVYEIVSHNQASKNLEYCLHISNSSLLFDTTINLFIYFNSEKQLDAFTKEIHLSDMENEFNRIRKILIQNDIQPEMKPKADPHYDLRFKPRSINYRADGTKLKY